MMRQEVLSHEAGEVEGGRIREGLMFRGGESFDSEGPEDFKHFKAEK